MRAQFQLRVPPIRSRGVQLLLLLYLDDGGIRNRNIVLPSPLCINADLFYVLSRVSRLSSGRALDAQVLLFLIYPRVGGRGIQI